MAGKPEENGAEGNSGEGAENQSSGSTNVQVQGGFCPWLELEVGKGRQLAPSCGSILAALALAAPSAASARRARGRGGGQSEKEGEGGGGGM